MAPTVPANNDGNCLPPPPVPYRDNNGDDSTYQDGGGYFNAADDTRGGFQRMGVNSSASDEVDEEEPLSLNELMYSAHSFHVISLPVSITMILAALAVTYVNTPETIQQGEALMSQAYHVWKVDSGDSTGKQLALDFANGLVIVTVIGTMTFGIVLLYKYRCMKFLMGYMAFSSMTLLGVLGAELFNVAIEKYRIPIDWFTFVFSMFNFAVVGVTSIFYAKGIPPYITQTYLICSSVIIAWQLSHFDTISTWTLLIMLALYDLCAVLTPVGPLRLLVNLMSDEDSPEMPGLLYEAQIPEGLKRPVMGGRNKDDNGDEGEHDDSSQSPPASMSAERYQQPSIKENGVPGRTSSDVSASQGDDSAPGVEMSSAVNRTRNDSYDSVTLDQSENNATTTPDLAPAHALSSAKTAMIPFAIAKLYRLPLTSSPPFSPGETKRKGRRQRTDVNDNISTSPLLSTDAAADDEAPATPSEDEESSGSFDSSYVIPDEEYTPPQLRTIVEAILPKNGAKIVKQPCRALPGDKEDRYGIIGSDGTLKRVLFVEKNGKVYEELLDDDDSAYEGRFSNTIKLGLVRESYRCLIQYLNFV